MGLTNTLPCQVYEIECQAYTVTILCEYLIVDDDDAHFAETFDLQYYIDLIFKKVPYLKTKAGICLLLAGFVFVFIIIPLMICGALCSKIRKIKYVIIAFLIYHNLACYQ